MEYIQNLMRRQAALAAAFEDAPEEAALAAVLPVSVAVAGEGAAAMDEAARRAAERPTADGTSAALLGQIQQAEQRAQALTALRQSGCAAQSGASASEERGAAQWNAAGADGGAVQTGIRWRPDGTQGAAEQSMAEISRFFERDARRYGG